MLLLFSQYKTYAQIQEEDESIKFIQSLSLIELMNLKITTAGKKSQNISDVPASVVIITRENIQTFGYQSLVDILADIPGFYNLGNVHLWGGYNFGVRGYSSQGDFNNVMILVNGVNQLEDFSGSFGTNKITVPVQAIDRIEIIRGPAAVVYGSNAFMGVINIITDEKSRERSNNLIAASYASLNTQEVSARVFGSSTTKTHHLISYTFNAATSQGDGQDISYGRLQSDPEVLQRFRLTPASRTKGQYAFENRYLNFSGKFDKFKFQTDYSQREEGIPTMVPSFESTEGWPLYTTASNMHASYGDSIRGVFDYEIRFTNSSFDNTSYHNNVFDEDYFNALVVKNRAQEYEFVSHYQPNDKTLFTLGLYHRSVNKLSRYVESPNVLQITKDLSRLTPSSRMRTLAAFSQIKHDITPSLKVVVGCRAEKIFKFDMTVPLPTTLPEPAEYVTRTFDKNDIQFIPRVATIYKLNDKSSLKFMYTQSNKRPSFVELGNAYFNEAAPLDYAKMRTFEGSYSGIINKYVSFNFGLFHNTLDNLIIRSVFINEQNAVSSRATNQGRASTIGSDLTLQGNFLDNDLRLEANICYQNTTDTRPDHKDMTYAHSPNWLGYGKISYTWSEQIKSGIKIRYVDEMQSTYDPISQQRVGPKAPAYTLIDTNIYSHIFKGFYAALLVSNVFDTEVRYSLNNFSSQWSDLGMIGFGRRFKLTAGYKF